MENIAIIFCLSFFFILTVISFLSIKFVILFLIISFFLSIFSFIFKKKLFLVLFISLCLSSGVFILNFFLKERFFFDFSNKKITVSGTIIDSIYENEGTFYYLLKINKIKNFKKIPNFNMEIITPFIIDINLGDYIEAEVQIFFSKNNYEKIKDYSKNIKAHGYFSDYLNIKFLENKDKININFIYKLRKYIIYKINEIFEIQASNLINIMWLNNKSKINKNLREGFSNLGISHLLAISGIHFSILIQFFYIFLNLIKIKRKILDLFFIFISIFFIILTGFAVSVLRAGIMFLIYLIGRLINRESDSLTSLSISVFLITFFKPNFCLDLGLWCSFLSTLGIVLFTEKINNYLENILNFNKNSNFFINKLLKFIISNLSVSLSSYIFVLPLIAIFFKKISMVFLISNIFIIFPITVFLFLTIIALLLKIILNFNFLIIFVNILAKIIINFIYEFSKFYFIVIGLDYLFIKVWIAFTILIIAMNYYYEKLNKNMIKIQVSSFLILFSGIFSYKYYIKNKITASFLYNNYNHSVVFSKNNQSFVIILDGDNLDNIKNYFQNSNLKNIECVLNFSDDIKDKIDFKKRLSFFKVKYFIDHKNLIDNDIFYFFNDILKIKVFKINKKIWLKIFINDFTFLLSINGGNADDVPYEIKKCNTFIVYKLPNNFKNIIYDNIILDLNNKFIDYHIKKMYEKDKIIPIDKNLYFDYDIKNKNYKFKSTK